MLTWFSNTWPFFVLVPCKRKLFLLWKDHLSWSPTPFMKWKRSLYRTSLFTIFLDMQTKGITGYNITSLQFSLFDSLLFHMLVYNNMGRFGTKIFFEGRFRVYNKMNMFWDQDEYVMSAYITNIYLEIEYFTLSGHSTQMVLSC